LALRVTRAMLVSVGQLVLLGCQDHPGHKVLQASVVQLELWVAVESVARRDHQARWALVDQRVTRVTVAFEVHRGFVEKLATQDHVGLVVTRANKVHVDKLVSRAPVVSLVLPGRQECRVRQVCVALVAFLARGVSKAHLVLRARVVPLVHKVHVVHVVQLAQQESLAEKERLAKWVQQAVEDQLVCEANRVSVETQERLASPANMVSKESVVHVATLDSLGHVVSVVPRVPLVLGFQDLLGVLAHAECLGPRDLLDRGEVLV